MKAKELDVEGLDEAGSIRLAKMVSELPLRVFGPADGGSVMRAAFATIDLGGEINQKCLVLTPTNKTGVRSFNLEGDKKQLSFFGIENGRKIILEWDFNGEAIKIYFYLNLS